MRLSEVDDDDEYVRMCTTRSGVSATRGMMLRAGTWCGAPRSRPSSPAAAANRDDDDDDTLSHIHTRAPSPRGVIASVPPPSTSNPRPSEDAHRIRYDDQTRRDDRRTHGYNAEGRKSGHCTDEANRPPQSPSSRARPRVSYKVITTTRRDL